MEYKIFAPSYRRAGGVTTQKYLRECTVVVAEAEAEEYERHGVRVWRIPDAVQGNIARVRNYILDHADCEAIVMLDDDLDHIGRWERGKDRRLTEEEVYEFIEQGFCLAADLGAHFWGMNQLADKGAYREYTPLGFLSPVLGPFQAHWRNPLRYDERIPLKEDYDMSLQVLRRFRRLLRFNAYHYACKQHTNPGGCAAMRTIGREKEQFALLQRKWGRRIVAQDGGADRVNRKKRPSYDINPIIHVPIKGV